MTGDFIQPGSSEPIQYSHKLGDASIALGIIIAVFSVVHLFAVKTGVVVDV